MTELPDTQIETERYPCVSPEARRQLELWGVSPERAEQLGDLAFDYSYVIDRTEIERIRAGGGIVDRDTNSVLLPDCFEYQGPRRYGHCAEIGTKLYTELHTNDWLTEVNAGLQEKNEPPLEVFYTIGNSRTHFSRPDASSHIWITINQAGRPIDESMLLDGSFHTVEMTNESGYAPLEWTQPTDMEVRSAAEIKLGEYSIGPEGAFFDFAGGPVIGSTESGNTMITLEFVAPKEGSGRIIPALSASDAEGRVSTCIINPETWAGWWLERDSAQVDDADKAEVIELTRQICTIDIGDGEPSTVAGLRGQTQKITI